MEVQERESSETNSTEEQGAHRPRPRPGRRRVRRLSLGRGRPGPVRLNALQHGLTAKTIVIPGVERIHDWTVHLAGVLESLRPVGYLETEHAVRHAALLWRLRRVVAHETAATTQINEWAKEHHEEECFTGIDNAWEPRRWLPDVDELETIDRHEAHLQRQLRKNLEDLWALQARRRKEGSAPPPPEAQRVAEATGA